MLLAGRNLVAAVRQLDDQSVLPLLGLSRDRDALLAEGMLRTPPQFRLQKRVAIASICAYSPTEVVRMVGTENHEQPGPRRLGLSSKGLCQAPWLRSLPGHGQVADRSQPESTDGALALMSSACHLWAIRSR